jgi:hypothetical protein
LSSVFVVLYSTHLLGIYVYGEDLYSIVMRPFLLMLYIDRKKGLYTPSQRHSLLFNVESSLAAIYTTCREGARAFGELHSIALPYHSQVRDAEQVGAIRKLDMVENREVHASKQLLFFAYALTMKGVTQELDRLGRTCRRRSEVILAVCGVRYVICGCG